MVNGHYWYTYSLIGMKQRLLDVVVLRWAAGGMSNHYLVDMKVKIYRGFQKRKKCW